MRNATLRYINVYNSVVLYIYTHFLLSNVSIYNKYKKINDMHRNKIFQAAFFILYVKLLILWCLIVAQNFCVKFGINSSHCKIIQAEYTSHKQDFQADLLRPLQFCIIQAVAKKMQGEKQAKWHGLKFDTI